MAKTPNKLAHADEILNDDVADGEYLLRSGSTIIGGAGGGGGGGPAKMFLTYTVAQAVATGVWRGPLEGFPPTTDTWNLSRGASSGDPTIFASDMFPRMPFNCKVTDVEFWASKSSTATQGDLRMWAVDNASNATPGSATFTQIGTDINIAPLASVNAQGGTTTFATNNTINQGDMLFIATNQTSGSGAIYWALTITLEEVV